MSRAHRPPTQRQLGQVRQCADRWWRNEFDTDEDDAFTYEPDVVFAKPPRKP